MRKKHILILFVIFQFIASEKEYNAELIKQKTDIYISNNKIKKSIYYEIQINNRAGEKFTKIAIPYSGLAKLVDLEAYIKDNNGKIVQKIKKKDITDRNSVSDMSFYEDNFVKEFTLKHNSYPYYIFYSYKIEETEFINIDNWAPILDLDIPTHEAILSLNIPIDYKINYLNQYIENFKIDTIDSRINYTWMANYEKIIKPEIYSPPLINYFPLVKIVPQKFHFDFSGSFNSWVEFGNWQYNLVQGLNELSESEKMKIRSITNNITDKKEKIRTLYHYLQDKTRYINVTVETGGLKPYPAIYVEKNNFGDCKALTNYFKSILDYLNIQSYYTKVYAGSPTAKINKDFPSQQFNHIILYIPLNNEDIWLDCTSDGPFNYLGTFSQNREAFIIDKDNSRFLKTPSLKFSDVVELRKITTYPDQNYKVKINFQNEYRGPIFESLVDLENSFNDSEKSKIIRNHFIEEGFDLLEYKIDLSNRDSTSIKLSYQANSPNIYKNYNAEILVNNFPFSLPRFEKPKNRKLPVQFDYPINKVDSILYNFPHGYILQKLPSNYFISNKYGQYKIEFTNQNNAILVYKEFILNSSKYESSEYEELYNFIEEVRKIENKIHLALTKK